MLGASRTSMAEVTSRLDSVLESADAATLSGELFQVVHLLDREHSLRRILADAWADDEAKTRLVGRLLETHVSPSTIVVVNDVVQAAWSAPRDLTDALERLAVFATVALAEADGKVQEVEDELFRFGRVIAAQPQLRAALTRPGVGAEALRSLIGDLLADRVHAATLQLVTQRVTSPRGRTLEQGLEAYAQLVAERARRSIAVVRTAAPLSENQRTRLQQLLSRRYGREVHLNIEVVPDIVGGMDVRVGDEVMDGTIAGRIAEARRRLAG